MSGLIGKLRSRGDGYASDGDVWDNEDARGRWPVLYSLLATVQDGEHRRETSKLTLYCQQGGLFCCIRCPSEGQIAHLRLDYEEHPFDAIESLLEAEKADWRKMGKSGARRT